MNTISSVASLYAPRLPENHVSEAVRKADPKNLLGSGRLHPVLRGKVEQLLDRAAQQGLKLHLFEGYRSLEAQAKIPAANTKAKPGFSYHNYGLAADIVFADERGRPSWDEKHDWNKLGELGKSLGLEWGGDWKNLVDRPHFQLPAPRIGEIRRIYQEGGLQGVWAAVK